MKEENILQKSNPVLGTFFYGNYFYGICAVALTVEATLQQRFPLNDPSYLLLIFFVTVLYYTYPYIRKSGPSNDPRTNWYTRNYNLMRWNQVVITIIIAASLIFFLKAHWQLVWKMSLQQWFLLLIFPMVAAAYYGLESSLGKFNLRSIGWLKPFIIGFTWAGLVTIYPVLFYNVTHGQDYAFVLIGFLLFLKNLMFIAMLCILFDIKDLDADYLSRLRTFVVNVGLRKTLFFIVVPLTLIGLGTFIFYARTHDFSSMKLFLNTIPFILLILTAWSLRKTRSLLYYLIIVDGLMLLKAICGTIAILYF